MDKTILKKFAISARKDLMNKIKRKINMFYIDEKFNKEQKGDIYVLSNDKHSLTLSKEEYEDREKLIKRIKDKSLEEVVEEASYTWFNRIIAIRYMELNDMLPLTKNNVSLGIHVLSSNDNEVDPEILKFTNLSNKELDLNINLNKYAELKSDDDKFKYILIKICHKLGKVIPQVFNGVTDYIDILILDNMLNENGFIYNLINEIPIDNFKNVEIIGWLYQYYNQEEKDRVISAKKAYKKNEIPYATQLFTPDWIVKYMVENSLGKYCLEHGYNQSLKNNWKYYIDSEIKEYEPKIRPTELTFIDPCCGSGHILVYAFEVLYQIYLSEGYNKNDIPELILTHNLYGLDIDDRAGQLSILSVVLKAREYDKDIFNKGIIQNLNIMSIQESSHIDNFVISGITDITSSDNLIYLIDTFTNAKEIGSLLLVENKDYSSVIKAIERDNSIFKSELEDEILPLIKQANILSKIYDIVVTNPPYMGNKGMSKILYDFAVKNYTDSKIDLFSMFISKCGDLCCKKGYYSLITPPSVLFLGSFEKLRKKIIKYKTICSLLHMGRGIFGVDFGSTSFVIKNDIVEDYSGKYFRLHERNFQYLEINDIEKIYLNANDNDNYKFDFFSYPDILQFDGYKKKIVYYNKQNNFSNIPGTPIAYWITEKEFNLFSKYNKLGNAFEARGGMTTGNNDLFLRLWYEIDNSKFITGLKKEEAILSNYKWFPYNKGGDYRKWYGNMNYVINWYKDGYDIKQYKLEQRKSNPRYNIAIAGLNCMFQPQISWSLVSAGNFGVRYYPQGFLFDVAGSSVLPDKENERYILAYLNSKVSDRYLKALNPTINYQPGDIGNLIFNEKDKKIVNEICDECISISKEDWDSFETSWDFKIHPLLAFRSSIYTGLGNNYESVIKTFSSKNIYGVTVINEKDKLMNCHIKSCYEAWGSFTENQFNQLKANEEELNRIFIDTYGLQDELTPEEDDKDVTIRKANELREIKSLISYAVGCMFGRYSIYKDGLQYAGGSFDLNYYANIAKNYEDKLESTEVHDGKLFMPDIDNIIPITDEAYFNDDIVSKFKEFIEVSFGKNTLNDNLDYIANVLGKKGTETSEDTIRRYFNDDFYNDHVKIYQKRPIYWLFDSGKKNGFKCLIYMHRYKEDTVSKIRLDYLHRMQEIYDQSLSEINHKLSQDLSMTDRKNAQNRQAILNAKKLECEAYDEKINHIASQKISIDLDDGVVVNYAKFQDVLLRVK